MRTGFTRHLTAIVVALGILLSVAYAEQRTWTDAGGKSTITAELVDAQKGKVQLRQSDGKEITVPLKNLSEADRDYVKSHATDHAANAANAKGADTRGADSKDTSSAGADDAFASIAKSFFTELRAADRDAARQSLTIKAQKAMKGEKSPLAELPSPDAGNHSIRVGAATVDGAVAEVPVQVRAGGKTHQTKLHLRQEGDQWRVFALSATYPDGEKSLNFEAAPGPQQQGDPLQAILGKPISLEGLTIDGKPLNTSQYKGKVVLVDFWATWCGPCRAEIPNVLANYKKYKSDGFDVIAISVDDDMDALKTFVADEKPPWTVVADSYPGNKNSMAARFGIRSIPAFILVGANGKVAAVNCRGEQLGQKLTQILGDPRAKLGSLDFRLER
jgi:thiol-disulfide isomerase/thioredoxin